MPNNSGGALERAFQLARTGKFRNIGEIKLQLLKEGFEEVTVGPYLTRLLTDIIAESSRRDVV